MANELQHRHTATGSTIYGIVRDAITGQVVVQADGSLETQVNANWGTYDIPLTETPAAGYFYAGDMPAAVAGTYVGTVYLQAGGSPALTDTIIGEWEPFTWDGTAVDDVPGLIAALNDLSAAQVNAEVVDVLRTDTNSELAQGVPPATPTFEEAVMFLYMALRNKLTVTATEKGIYNDAGTKVARKTLSDDGTVYTEAEAVSGA